jgi:hypothetical protein
MELEYRSVVIRKRAKLSGHRFYTTATVDQMTDRWMIAPAALKDGKMPPAFFEGQYNLLILADYGFRSPLDIHGLHENRNITLTTGKRKDALKLHPTWFQRRLRRLRRRIETAFGVITVVLNLETPGSSTLGGLLCRLATTVPAHDLPILMNFELQAITTRN